MARWPRGVITPGGTAPTMTHFTPIAPIVEDYGKIHLHLAQEAFMIEPYSNEDTDMQWSANQNNIFNWFKEAAKAPAEPRSLVVKAVAGSGKTTTIAEASKYIPVDVASVFLAFNKSIATELGKKLPTNVESRTLNSLGHRAVMGKFGQVAIDTSKTMKIVRELPNEFGLDGQEYVAKYYAGDICQLVSKAKAHGLVPHENMNGELADAFSLQELKDHYNLYSECPDDVLVDFVVGALKKTIRQTNIIDFDDQLYFVVAFDLPVPQYSWIIVDEAQDLSHINRAMLRKFLATNGNLIAVGDDAQCQPKGTQISMTGGDYKAIEDIEVGDEVVTYNSRKSYFPGTVTQGRKVEQISHREFKGKLIEVCTPDTFSRYTHNHRCHVRIDSRAKDLYCTYLMQKGDLFRIGTTQMLVRKGDGSFGPAMRARQEKADRLWILSVSSDKRQAYMDEQCNIVSYGIPGTVFNADNCITTTQQWIDEFYRKIDFSSVQKIFSDFGLDVNYPLWAKLSNIHIGKYSFITQACNLIPECMQVRQFDLSPRGGAWVPFSLYEYDYAGNVYSLKVQPTETGRRLYIADDIVTHNSIYGFRGASSGSLDIIIQDFNADQLPLDTTYRCPKLIVEIAQQYVPEINCPSDAPEGTVSIHDKFELGDFENDDLVICRNTAPLITSAYRMIRHGYPVRVMGRDIGKGLTSLIKKISRREFKYMSMGDFEKALSKWMRKQIDIAKRRDQEDRIEVIQDKAESLFAIIAGSDVDTLPEVCFIIDDLFQGDRGPRFATIHKAKGLEAARVFILDADLMPSQFAKKPWQIQQESNLIYVAVTRSSDTLCYIDSKRLM